MNKNNTTILSLLFSIFLFVSQVNAQTYYSMSSGDYFQDFNDISNVTNWPNGFGGPSSLNWQGLPVNPTGTIPDGIRITNQTNESFSSGGSTGVQRGTESIQLLTTGTTDNSTAIGIELLLDFSNRVAGSLNFNSAQVNNGTGNRVSTLRLFYSLDGTTYTEITGGNLPFSVTNNASPISSANINVSLPTDISDQPQVRFRFYCHNGSGGTTGSRPKISIDDLLVTSSSNVNFDLRLRSFTITPQQPMVGDNLNLDFAIDNSGLQAATNYSLNVYYDENRNGIPDPNELINTQNFAVLNPGDSVLHNFVIQNIDSGFKQYIGVVDFPPDQDTSNNRLIRSVTVGGPPPPVTGDIVVNEIMYAPTDATNEWFELYNKGNEPVNISNWKWRDLQGATLRTITTNNISIPPDGYIIVCQDSVKFKDRFPGTTGTIIQSMGWSTLNNSGDDGVTLYNASNEKVDSVIYNSSWGGLGGFSLERKLADGISNDPNNWATSVAVDRATPNRVNSVTPKDFDIALTRFAVEPLFPAVNESVRFDFTIKNLGINVAQNFILNIYDDLNFDTVPSSGELINSNTFANLNPGDSVLYSFTLQNLDSGLKQIIAIVDYPPDEDPSNNRLVRNFRVGGETGGNFVINEIMFDPLVGQAEWVELYNATGQIVNIRNYKFIESNNIFSFSPNEDYFINPGDFIVIAGDTTIYERFGHLRNLEPGQHLFFNSMSLSNSGEVLTFTDSLGNILDQVDYKANWKNPNIPNAKGISLERINPRLGSNERSNWSSSANPLGGTPCLPNSIFTPFLPSTGELTISPNPFSPDGDGFEDFTIINYKLTVPFAQLRGKIFDVKGRLVRTLANNQLTASEGQIIFNGLDDDNRRLRIGIYVVFLEAIDDQGGTIEILKAPVVIATKL